MVSTRNTQPIDFPERIGRYELLAPIGSGGMARVFLARASGAEGFERDVALKLLHPHLREVPEFVADLLDEARILASLHHANVVQILDVVADGPEVYLVMEYVEGDSLGGLLKAGRVRDDPLPWPIGVKILTDALAGLHAAHELKDKSGAPLGLVHRDFSPQNILVGIDGSSRLTDFGVVKAAGKLGHTKTGLVKGKVRYMSPEQARAKAIDRRSDVWAAGVVAWELFARRALYIGHDDASMLLQIVSERPPPLSSAWPDAPPELDQAIASALEPAPEQRCPSAEQLRRRILSAWSKSHTVADVGEVGDWVARATEHKREARRALIDANAALQTTTVRSASDGRVSSDAQARAADDAPHSEPVTEAATVTAAEHSVTRATARAQDPADRVRRDRVRAIGLVVLVVVLARSDKRGAAHADGSAATPTGPPRPSCPAPWRRVETPTAPAQLANQIRVVADRPIAKLRIGSRLVAIAPPEKDVTVRLTDQELAARERVEAVAADGTHMALEIDGTADTLDIDFSSAKQAPHARTPSAGERRSGGAEPVS